MSGRGVLVHSNGSQYEGEFLNGLRHGKGAHLALFLVPLSPLPGVFTWTDGERFEGEYVGDLKQGRGKYVWGDGSVVPIWLSQ
jgi:hypothetical protein